MFEESGDRDRAQAMPLAARLRPTDLSEVYGQEHLLGSLGPLKAATLHSTILFGPPGTGKTTVAQILAQSHQAYFVPLSATDATIVKIRALAQDARERWNLYGKGTIVFIDEIHRLNKTQQDTLLPIIEDGTLILMGATTENPWATLNPALLSRCQLVEFHPLSPSALTRILERAWERRDSWWRSDGEYTDDLLSVLAERAGGDARLALTLLEGMAHLAKAEGICRMTPELLERVGGGSPHYHDRAGDRHYDLTSALIKSMRGSDPDAALYWFGRLLAGGEDPRYVMRRVLIHAAEDVGLADPSALLVAQAAHYALEHVGLPEARIPMAEAVLYIALAPKSNSVVAALRQMDRAIEKWPSAPVPEELKDRHYRPDIDQPYRYPHDAPEHFLPDPHLPPECADIELYRPGNLGEEPKLSIRLNNWRHTRARWRLRAKPPAEPN